MFVPPEHLLPSTLVDELGRLVATVYGDLERQLVARAKAIFAEGMGERPDLAARMQALRELEAEARRMIAGINPEFASEIIGIASERGIQAAITALGIIPGLDRASLMRPADARAITALTADLQNGLTEVHRRILRYPQDVYQRITAWSAPGVLAGQDTLLAAQRRAVQRFLSEGVTGFVDVADRQWRIGTYAEMATRTAAARAWTDSGISTMHDAGITLVSIVVGNSACKRCAHWATRILSTDGTPAGVYEMPHATQDHMVRVRVDGTLDDARAAGLMHPNCGCAAVAYLPGLTVVADATTYDAQAEAERTAQRTLEREARKAKRAIAAGDNAPNAREDLRDAQAALRKHVKSTGSARRSYREQLWFTDGRPDSSKRGVIAEGKPYLLDLHDPYTRLATAGLDITPLDGYNARISGARWTTRRAKGDGHDLTTLLTDAGRTSNRAVIDISASTLPTGQALERINEYAEQSGLTEVMLITPKRVARFDLQRGWIPVA
ncbi:phage minor capsid protein [Mycetocola spongiae]|uniref:phage minor capsid protein n=1 Tax=Mycetocola spongiae TaxID=2859226 RepID=UPI001CF2DE16|nr:phage minor capsid protein [Mycetocola spongiae]UCR89255.1 phage minor capsid protein [Mycetocola spongiae]